jgi:hypothetical protein
MKAIELVFTTFVAALILAVLIFAVPAYAAHLPIPTQQTVRCFDRQPALDSYRIKWSEVMIARGIVTGGDRIIEISSSESRGWTVHFTWANRPNQLCPIAGGFDKQWNVDGDSGAVQYYGSRPLSGLLTITQRDGGWLYTFSTPTHVIHTESLLAWEYLFENPTRDAPVASPSEPPPPEPELDIGL